MKGTGPEVAIPPLEREAWEGALALGERERSAPGTSKASDGLSMKPTFPPLA